jgi:fructokinase
VTVLGGIEAGGTKWVCAVGTGPDDLSAVETFPTTSPDETIGRAHDFFARHGPIDALGIGCFGPVDLDPSSATWGHVTTTPKPGWTGADVAQRLGRLLAVPVAFDTDVDAAAVGERRWGAARGLDTFCYVTVGTGIGGGAIVGGKPLHGLLHPEFGHLRIPHDSALDPFAGLCPYHGDCWEGLASGPAIAARWGKPGEELAGVDAVWQLEATYLALGLVSAISILSPQRIVIGGGVMDAPGLLPLVGKRVVELVAGYLDAPALGIGIDDYLVSPALGRQAGVLGALALAEGGLTPD